MGSKLSWKIFGKFAKINLQTSTKQNKVGLWAAANGLFLPLFIVNSLLISGSIERLRHFYFIVFRRRCIYVHWVSCSQLPCIAMRRLWWFRAIVEALWHWAEKMQCPPLKKYGCRSKLVVGLGLIEMGKCSNYHQDFVINLEHAVKVSIFQNKLNAVYKV